jgi:GTPase
MKDALHNVGKGSVQKALIAAIRVDRQSLEETTDSANELKALVEAAGAMVVGDVLCNVQSIQSGTFIGSGKVDEIAEKINELNADFVAIDVELSPPQQRNLEKHWNVQVIDRTGIILDIFAQRAATREGSLQVELAQLEYRLPRLTRMWTHLSRLGAGIGTRGPGETQLEVDRRQIRTRLTKIRKDLDKIKKRRNLQRENRQRSGCICAALVGYTNAGKSTLLNLLTDANVPVKNQLFVTLDPTIRKLQLPNQQAMYLSDTVGFVSRLPHELIAAFHATLEEVIQADLLLHVVDYASPQRNEQIADVENVLKELGVENTPMIRVYNKIDLVADNGMDNTSNSDWVAISAARNIGIEALQEKLIEFVTINETEAELFVPYKETAVIAVIRNTCAVTSETYEHDGTRLQIIAKRALLNKYRRFVLSGSKNPEKPGGSSVK